MQYHSLNRAHFNFRLLTIVGIGFKISILSLNLFHTIFSGRRRRRRRHELIWHFAEYLFLAIQVHAVLYMYFEYSTHYVCIPLHSSVY